MFKNINIVLKSFFFVMMVSLSFSQFIYADNNVNLIIKNNGSVIFSGNLVLPGNGVVDIVDTNGNTHGVNTRSVINIVKEADVVSSDFNISNLIYYSMFDAFYLKCITPASSGELCDGWQYKINGTDPGTGMDQSILSGGENIVLYFGKDDDTLSNNVYGGAPLSEYVPATEVPALPAEAVATIKTIVEVSPLIENIPNIIPLVSENKNENIIPIINEENKKEPKKVNATLKKSSNVPVELVSNSNYQNVNVATPILALDENKTNTKKESIFLKIIRMIFGL